MTKWPFALLIACTVTGTAHAYPTDGFERTGIRRLPWQRAIDEGLRRGRKDPPGAQWPSSAIALRMAGAGKGFNLTADTPKDEALQRGLEEILQRNRWRRYNVAILDFTDPAKPRYAAVNEQEPQTPGSVAKLLVGAGLFAELERRFPNDTAAREKMLREVLVKADGWAMPNHHEVPVVPHPFDPATSKTSVRRVYEGDEFSLWEWLDHALSPSSNASATMAWREAVLMRLLGEAYPPTKYDDALWSQWDRDTLTKAAFDVVSEPIVEAGVDPEQFFLRMFFTKGANRFIRSDTSRATPLGILQFWLRVEQGRMVDAFSSLELKRLAYLTRRRIRYVHSSKLDDSAVYFKSGSLYQCQPEEGFACGKYQGNVVNVLNSLAVVETPVPPPAAEASGPPAEGPAVDDAVAKSATPQAAATTPAVAMHPGPLAHTYMVAVMSNELRRNAASDHALLAGEIHSLITQQGEPTP